VLNFFGAGDTREAPEHDKSGAADKAHFSAGRGLSIQGKDNFSVSALPLLKSVDCRLKRIIALKKRPNLWIIVRLHE
jgi:hypothetical protein